MGKQKHGPNWYDNFIEKYKIDPLNVQLKENEKIAVIGDIHEQDRLYKTLKQKLTSESSDIKIVSVGDLYDKGEGQIYAEIVLRDLLLNTIGLIKGNHEIKKIKYYRKTNSPLEKDLSDIPNALSFVWPNGFRLTCVHAGVIPRHTWEDLKYNSEICYVRTVNDKGEMIPLIWVEKNGVKVLEPKEPNGKSWHEVYDGRFGYIVSGHEQQDDAVPKFYKYSANIDTAAYETGILTAAIIGQNGFEKIAQTGK
jgi:predicted phosphodiesterase